LRFGKVWSLFVTAARTRSRASDKVASGRPIRVVFGRPIAMSAATSTR
jgi:hypothetical protein